VGNGKKTYAIAKASTQIIREEKKAQCRKILVSLPAPRFLTSLSKNVK
jgi:hypothetical protein